MSLNEQQGRWLLENRVLTREQLTYAWSQSSAHIDLCATLQALQMLTEEQATYTRAKCAEQSVRRSASSHHDLTTIPSSPQSSDALLTVLPPSRPASSGSQYDSGSSSQSPGTPSKAFEHPEYKIEKELGRGGMGVVYLGRQKELGYLVVIKVINSKRADVVGVSRFQREATALIKLRHPNIVVMKDYGESEGQPYFVMDFVKGSDLQKFVVEKLREGELDTGLMVRIFTELAKALIYCHHQGLLHRDLKPANILIDADSLRPVLIDFGLVSALKDEEGKLIEGVQDELTKTGQTIGTPAYMPPEQLDMKGEFGKVSEKSDVWGFGATLFYALTGEAPIKGATPMNIYKALMTQKVRAPSSITTSIPLWLDDLCKACLQKESERRPTMAQILQALESGKSAPLFPKQSRSTKPIFAGIAFFLALGLALILHNQLSDTTPPVLQIAKSLRPGLKEGYYTQRSIVLLQGRLQDENPEQVLIKCLSDFAYEEFVPIEKGAFKVSVEMPEGQHRFSLQGFDSSGNVSAEAALTVIVDLTAPVITFNRLDPKRDITATEVVIRGRLSEAQCQLSTNLDQIKVNGQSFEYRLKRTRPWGDLDFFVKDAAGNVSETLYQQYLVRSKGPRSHNQLPGALQKCVHGSRIILGEGSYTTPMELNKDIEIIALGNRNKTRLLGKGGDGDFILVKDASVRVVGVELGHTNATTKASIASVYGGRFRLEDSTVVISGSHGFRALEAPPNARSQSILDLKNCEIRREKLRNLDADLISLKAAIGRFQDLNVIDNGKGLLDLRRPSLIEGRQGSSIWVTGMALNKWKGRGITQRGGVGHYSKLSFFDHGDYSIETNAGLVFADTIKVRNAIAHGLLFTLASRVFLSNSKIQGCERLDYAKDNEKKETAYKSGIYVTQSRLLVKNSLLGNNQGYGLRVSPKKDEGRATVVNCNFENNGLGPSNRLNEVKILTVEPDSGGAKDLNEVLKKPSDEFGTVYRLKPGRYKVSAKIPMGVKIVGTGTRDEVILEPKSGLVFSLDRAILTLENLTLRSSREDPLLAIPQGSGCLMSNCVLDAPLSFSPIPGRFEKHEKGSPGRPYIELRDCMLQWKKLEQNFTGIEARFEDCDFRGSGGSDLTFSKRCHARLKGCDFLGVRVKILGASAVFAESCQFRGSPEDGVYCEESLGEFKGCSFLKAKKYGAFFENSRVQLERCRFEKSGASGVKLNRSRGRFTSCIFNRNGDYGLLVNERSSALLEDVSFQDSTRRDVSVGEASQVIRRLGK
ncbi:MAG: protein kinase [Planctomycetota bacterium]|nr:protein kinase [Planctomycetota bacterium]